MSRVMRATLVTLAVLGVVGAGACGTAVSSSPAPSSRGTLAGSPSPTGGMPVKPHLQTLPGGRALASGWLRHIDLEGGFWALTADAPGVKADAPHVVAVLLPHRIGEAAIASRDGSYLVVRGRLSTGVSIRASGPEILVDGIKPLGMGQ